MELPPPPSSPADMPATAAARATGQLRRGSGSGGGVLIALGVIIGPAVGLYHGSPSIGLLVGMGIGCALAILLWWLGAQR